MAAKKTKKKTIRITLKRSRYGRSPRQEKTLEALGLRKVGGSTEKEATPAILGMVQKVSHLVEVEEIG
jgi:large subunit ribosomal protein L30